MSAPLNTVSQRCFYLGTSRKQIREETVTSRQNMFALKCVQSSSKYFATKLLKNNLRTLDQICDKKFPRKQSTGYDYVELNIRGESLKFPSVWLRDNCQCEKCFHHSAQSRIIDWTNFNVNVKAVEVKQDAETVQISWDDSHQSEFRLDWLSFRSFSTDRQKLYSETIYQPSKITWHGDEFPTICSKHDYNDILTNDRALYDWLHKLSVFGVALIENTPNTETASNKIVQKVAFPKQTHYGVTFKVQNIPNTSNVAYLSSNLQMHTDLPYYEYCPGVNMLHCLVQTSSHGGDNLLSDAHYTANYMKENHPEEHRLLSETEVEWSDIGNEHENDFYKLYRSPIICLNKQREITRINFSIPQRGSHFLGCIDNVKPWYEAHALFMKLNHRFAAKFKTKPGDILVFDNIRLLHGRNAYEDSLVNVRKLIGTYVDWDEIYSRLRCLSAKQKSGIKDVL